jgi:uncharacterized protein
VSNVQSPEAGHLAQLQAAFCAHLRDPKTVPGPADVAPERLKVYSGFVFANMQDFMSYNYPTLKEVLGEEGFDQLIRDYLREHRAQTPLFSELPGELLSYLHTGRQHPEDPPFLFELAHFEFMESVLAVETRDADLAGIDRDGDLFEQLPVLSTLVLPLAYRFPVHRINAEFKPAEPPADPTYIVVYRDLSDKVGYMDLNRVSARLLERLQKLPEYTGRAHCEAIAEELQHPDPAAVLEGGASLLREWRTRDIVLGTRLASN